MTLTRLSAVSTALLLVLIGLLLSRILYTEWLTVRATDRGLQAMHVAADALVAAEKVSFERGPANGILGDPLPHDPAKVRRLAAARASTDAAWATLDRAIAAAPQTVQTRHAAAKMVAAHAELAAARAQVDRVAALPPARRSRRGVMGAVHAQFDVVPTVMQAAGLLSRNAEDAYPQLADALVGARLAAELREYAGRLGSQYTAALAARVPLARADDLAAWETRGRIDELNELLTRRIVPEAPAPAVDAAAHRVAVRYFGDDLRFVDEIQRDSDERRPYGIDTAEFAARYVPPMATIVALRDELLSVAFQRAGAVHRAALRGMAATVVLGAAMLAVVTAVLVVLRRRVIRPLVVTARVITEIARGDLDTVVPPPRRRDEIGAVLAAVETLKRNSAEKAALETERQRLIEELRHSSTTDYLTGLTNRRAFVAAAEQQLANARRYGWPVAVVLFDIDRFKAVNDGYGHAAGDTVLLAVADAAVRSFRAGDLVCRYGGEEFAALAPQCSLEDAASLAERVRAAIAAAPILLPDGTTLGVTASFGVAAAGREAIPALDDLSRLADDALYRAKDQGRDRVVLTTVPPPGPEEPRAPAGPDPAPTASR